jgi:hypothetical protein
MMSLIPRGYISRAFFAAAVATLLAIPVLCQDDPETLVVTSVNTRGWSTADTRPGGTVDFVQDANAPRGTGALSLQTDATMAAKAQYLHASNTAIAEVTDLSYWTKQNSSSFPEGDPSYQFVVCLGGVSGSTCTGFTTFVFEPYQNASPGTIQNGAWQQWDVDAGQMWSSQPYANGTCSVAPGGGGAPFYTLSQIQTMCPSAVAVGFGVNVGSNNPSYNVEADLVRFNDTIYDFEVFSTPSNMDECKNGGWSTFNPPTGAFKNQGQCVSSTVPQ